MIDLIISLIFKCNIEQGYGIDLYLPNDVGIQIWIGQPNSICYFLLPKLNIEAQAQAILF